MNTYITLALALLLCGAVPLSAQFSAPVSIPIPFNDTISRYEVLDFEGDGDLDLFIETDTAYYWLPNEGDGTFAPPVALEQLQGDIEVIPIDYESDGDIDLVFFLQTEEVFKTFYVFLQAEDGSFSEAIPFYQWHYHFNYQLGHFNSDGYIDVLKEPDYSGALVFYNPIDTAILDWTSEWFGNSWDFNLIGVADLDRNGQLDIVGCFSQHRQQVVYYFGDNPNRVPIGHGCGSNSARFFDISGDNLLDWIDLGGNVFARDREALRLRDFSASDLIDEGDLNEDGLADFLVRQEEELVTYYNYGEAQFSSPIPIGTEIDFNDTRHPYFADLDRDGLLDVIAIRQTPQELIWFRNENQLNATIVSCYWDENSNGTREPDEITIPNLPVLQKAPNFTHFTDSVGEVEIRQFFPADTLEVVGTDFWTPLASTQYYAQSDWVGDTLHIGYISTVTPSIGEPVINVFRGASSCGETMTLQVRLDAANGGEVPSGVLALVLDEDTPLLNTNLESDLIEGQTYWWTVDELPAGQAWTNELDLLFPDSSAIGDTLNYSWYFFRENCDNEPIPDAPASDLNEGLNLCTEGSDQFVVDCAIVTNDKQVSPRYLPPANYITADEFLTYTIRFTNTTTEQQAKCIIHDRLDRNLDWSSLQIVDASHPHRVVLNETTGELQIHLTTSNFPPVGVDPLASQGYVTYQIRPIDVTLSSVIIKNSAEIIFNNEPVITTNTVKNTLVDVRPEAQAPKAAFNFVIERDSLELYTFDQSLHQPSDWRWTFGDGASSNDINAFHRYDAPGTYDVCLYVSNAEGMDSLCQTLVFPANYVDSIPIGAPRLVRSSNYSHIFCLPGDFDGNGAPDIITAKHRNSRQVEIVFNRGDGSFSPVVSIDSGPETASDLAAADLEGDGDLDLIVALSNGQVLGYFNQGDGSFDPPQVLAERESETELEAISIADLDQDGDFDLIIGWPNYLTWLPNNGNGQFNVTHIMSEEFTKIGDIATGDLEGDGDLDVVVNATIYSTSLVVSFTQENVFFLPTQRIAPLTVWPSDWTSTIYLVDLTNDGLPELIHGYYDNNGNNGFIYSWKRVRKNENGRFTNQITSTWDNGVGTGDLDNDGDIDLAYGNTNLVPFFDQGLFIRINQGDGRSFGGHAIDASLPVSGFLLAIFLIDMDQDDDLDILTQSNSRIQWYENNLTPQQPQANFTYETNGLTVNFTDQSSRNPDEWRWTFGAAGPGSTLQNPIYEFPEEGTYTVCLHVRNEDGRSVSCEDVTLLINNTAELNRKSFQLYPNPTVGEVTLTLQEAFSTPTYLQLYDPLGQVLGHAIPIKGTQVILDLRPYPAGNYSFRLFNDKGLITQGKLVRMP